MVLRRVASRAPQRKILKEGRGLTIPVPTRVAALYQTAVRRDLESDSLKREARMNERTNGIDVPVARRV